jgi:aryl-alcohol dehydrogenase-like predicted oxidoreductase
MTRRIGTVEVMPIGLGALPLSVEGRPSRDQAVATIRAALDAGVTLIDTADSYCLGPDDVGHNERLVADVLRRTGARDVLVATKGGHYRPGDGSWPVNGDPRWLRAACEGSLRALGVDVIDLYQFHRPDPAVPFEDSVGAIAQLRQEGKVRAVGLSNVTVAQLSSALTITEVVSVQNRFSPLLTEDRAVLDHCAAKGIAFLPWAPLGGLGTGRTLAGRQPALRELAEQRGVSVQQLCLAWLLAQADVVVPIPGASRPESIQDSAAAATLTLTGQELAVLDEVAGHGQHQHS